MVFARRVNLFRFEIIERISPAGLELLLSTAGRISEGQISSGDQYFGSTMITLDLAQIADQLSDARDVTAARRLGQQLETEQATLAEVRQVAVAEAERIAGRPLEQVETDVRIRVETHRVHIDVDVEAIASPRVARQRS